MIYFTNDKHSHFTKKNYNNNPFYERGNISPEFWSISHPGINIGLVINGLFTN